MNYQRLPLIGLSGKIGAGKDLTAALIQRVFLEEAFNKGYGKRLSSLEELAASSEIQNSLNGSMSSAYITQRFADKLKQFVANILGVEVWKLDDQDFKRSELGHEWAYLKKWENNGRMIFKRNEKVGMTVREMLIRIGDGMRNVVHPDIWVNALFADYKEDNHYAWIIKDMRYPNEKERIQKLAGVTIRINRNNCTLIDHISETALDNEQFTYTIDNNGSLQELYDQIKNIVHDIRSTKLVY